MAEVVRTLDIPAALEVAWETLADFERISAWAPNVDHSCLLSEQAGGVGATRRIQSGRITVVERVLAWDAPNVLSYRIEGLPAAISSVVNTWSLAASPAGTAASVTTSVRVGPRPPQQVAARAIARRLGGVSDTMLAGLRDHILQAQGLQAEGDPA